MHTSYPCLHFTILPEWSDLCNLNWRTHSTADSFTPAWVWRRTVAICWDCACTGTLPWLSRRPRPMSKLWWRRAAWMRRILRSDWGRRYVADGASLELCILSTSVYENPVACKCLLLFRYELNPILRSEGKQIYWHLRCISFWNHCIYLYIDTVKRKCKILGLM